MAVLVVFICTQLPTAFYAIYRLFLPLKKVMTCGSRLRFVSTASDALTVLNSAINFLIYYPSAATFRKTLNELWTPSSSSSIKFIRRPSRSTSTRSSLNKLSIVRSSQRVITGESVEPPLLLTTTSKYSNHESVQLQSIPVVQVQHRNA